MSSFPELKILTCSNETAFINAFEEHTSRLVSSWMGRRLVAIKASWLMKQHKLSPTSIEALYEKSLLKVTQSGAIWAFWQMLCDQGVYLKRDRSSYHVWKYIRPLQESPSLAFKLWYKITSTSRIIFRMIGFYFGIDPRFLFGAKSFWDLEQRFTSLKNLSGALMTGAIGMYQAVHLSSVLITSLALELSTFSHLLLVSSLALFSITALGVLFYKLGQWFGGTPLEIWKCKNLTHEVSHEQEPISYGREKELSQLLSFFASPKASVALIRGEAGSGKTVLVKELARRLARDVLPPTLSRPQVFLLNGAQVNGEAYSQPTEKLNVIREQIEGYEKDIILAIDEAHVLSEACIELLKQWKDEGMRIILLTNASTDQLKEKWSKATYESLLTHTKSTSLELDGKNEDLLRKIMERHLQEHPYFEISSSDKEELIQSVIKESAAARLLTQTLLAKIAQQKAQYCHQEAILRLSQEIFDDENEIARLAQQGQWRKAQERTELLEPKLSQRDQLLQEANDRHEKMNQVTERRQRFKQLQSLMATWVQTQKIAEEQTYFLNTTCHIFSQALSS